MSLTPREAFKQLQEGNGRFFAGLRSVHSLATEERRRNLAEQGQNPFAMVLSCSDARVPAEIVFDCGLGDLFVVRVAGNVIAPSLIGSLEFAAEKFDTPLCLVLGHTDCGAINATFEHVVSNKIPNSENIRMITESIGPAVTHVCSDVTEIAQDDLLYSITVQNVRQSVQRIIEASAILRQRIIEQKVAIVGAIYSLHDGRVSFFEPDEYTTNVRDILALSNLKSTDYYSSEIKIV